MPETPENLLKHLDSLGISVEVHEHAPLMTVEDSKALRGDLPGGHHKNLFLRDKKKRNFLVVTGEDTPVDMKSLSAKIGANHLSFGSAERLMEFLGVLPGSVTPFAVLNDPECKVQVVLDEAIFGQEPLNFHPLVNTMTVAVSAEGLLAFLRAGGHDPLIVAL